MAKNKEPLYFTLPDSTFAHVTLLTWNDLVSLLIPFCKSSLGTCKLSLIEAQALFVQIAFTLT